MDFFDNVVNKTKEVMDVAYNKTSEVVSVQKQKFNLSSIEAKLEKDFAELGKIYFELIKDGEIDDPKTAEVVAGISEKTGQIEKLKEEISSLKKQRICPKCSAKNAQDAVFCATCGAKIIFDSAET